jgi:hypothetical protein
MVGHVLLPEPDARPDPADGCQRNPVPTISRKNERSGFVPRSRGASLLLCRIVAP